MALAPRPSVGALAVLVMAASLLSCGSDGESDDGAASGAPTASATVAGVPAAPSEVTVTGPLPDLQTPLPPDAESGIGRVNIAWRDNSSDEDGFRVYRECAASGLVTDLGELPANAADLGPVPPCRPGRVGVSSFNGFGESDIVWVP